MGPEVGCAGDAFQHLLSNLLFVTERDNIALWEEQVVLDLVHGGSDFAVLTVVFYAVFSDYDGVEFAMKGRDSMSFQVSMWL